jgi:hypothetical protein
LKWNGAESLVQDANNTSISEPLARSLGILYASV